MIPGAKTIRLAVLYSGETVIVDHRYGVNSMGIFFPVGTRLSSEFLSWNNLYRDRFKNRDINEEGYFKDNGKVEAQRFVGLKTEGFFIPLKSLLFMATSAEIAQLRERDCFDQVYGMELCCEYKPEHVKKLPTFHSKKQVKKAVRSVNRELTRRVAKVKVRMNIVEN
jgi:hypothetical protein